MATWRDLAIDAGMDFFRACGAHRLAAPFTRGLGAILMFHRVQRPTPQSFEPNKGLEISVDFFDALLGLLRQRGYRFLSLEAALAELGQPRASEPFVVLSFDDGYRDLMECALPVMERHHAPFIAYITSGFAEARARLWWVELEEAFRRLNRIDVTVQGQHISLPCADPVEKSKAHAKLYWALRQGPEDELLRVAAALSAEAGVESLRLTRELCLDWNALASLARHELATIGAHSVTHARLAKLEDLATREEMAQSRASIAANLGVDARHFCYPVGDPTSAGAREFALARELGFASAVTTRPGMIFADHKEHLLALPRLSINGKRQSLADVDVLLSGAPFALMNGGRRVRAA